MANLLDTFTTLSHQDFQWPYPKPLLSKPSQPPMNTGTRLYLRRPNPDDCACDIHAFQRDMDRYKQLSNKERHLHEELISTNREITNLMANILENKCHSEEETMKSIYQTDYEKKGVPLSQYRSLLTAVESPTVTRLTDGYRNSTRFRYTSSERPNIQPAQTINFLKIPESFSMWSNPFTGRSEYMDTFSKIGLSNMKNRQQYLEPLLSSRRRFGDWKI